jgi:TRAP transporter TAXI family solute receptor
MFKMKNTISSLKWPMALCIVAAGLALVLAVPQMATAKQLRYSFGAAPMGGGWYPMAGALAEMWTKNIDNLSVTVEGGGGARINPKWLSSGQVEVAFQILEYMRYAKLGQKPYEKKYDLSAARSMILMNVSPSHISVLKKSGITKISDVKGKRIAIGEKGTSDNDKARYILEAVGLSIGDVKVEYIGGEQASEALSDGRIDAWFEWFAAPNPVCINLATTSDVTFIDFDQQLLNNIFEKYPWFAPTVIPAGTYRGQDKALNGFGAGGVMFVRKEVPEDVVYQMCKLMHENWDQLIKAHGSFAYWKWEPDIEKISGYSLHPGALKFYKEKGFIK